MSPYQALVAERFGSPSMSFGRDIIERAESKRENARRLKEAEHFLMGAQ